MLRQHAADPDDARMPRGKEAAASVDLCAYLSLRAVLSYDVRPAAQRVVK